jgi:Family of unknown function (DUF6941)
MPEIELLTVANHAEAINGLLYLSGAGWTDLRRPMPPEGPPPVNHIGIAIAVLVGWNETNQRHRINLRLETADGRELANMQADLEMGRPPGLPQGSDLRGVIAINAELQFPTAGIYRVLAAVADNRRSISFRVHDVPAAGIAAVPPRQ